MLIALIALIVIPVAVLAAQDQYGSVEFLIRAGGSAQDKLIYLKPAFESIPFDSRFMYTDEIPNQNPGWSTVEIQPMGITLPVVLNPGMITACIRNSNGNQPECQNFNLNVGEQKRVVLLGSPVGSGKHVEPIDECQPVTQTYAIGPAKAYGTRTVSFVWINPNTETKTINVQIVEKYWVCENERYVSCLPEPVCTIEERTVFDKEIILTPGTTTKPPSDPYVISYDEGHISYSMLNSNGC